MFQSYWLTNVLRCAVQYVFSGKRPAKVGSRSWLHYYFTKWFQLFQKVLTASNSKSTKTHN